jgi:hypothetical protein
MGSTLVVHFFISLQGWPLELNAEKESVALLDWNSLVMYTLEGGGFYGYGLSLCKLITQD